MICAVLAALLAALACRAPSAMRAPPLLVDLERGETALAVGDGAAALVHFERALARRPADPRAQRGAALALLELDRPAEALALLDALAAAAPQRFDAALRDAHCAALVRSIERALAAGRPFDGLRLADGSSACEAERRRGLGLRALLAAARAEQAAGAPRRALALYRAALERDRAHPAAAREAARLLLAAGRTREAIDVLDPALARHPADGALIALMVQALGGPALPAPRP